MGSIWGKSGDSFWTSEDIEVGHFGSEENHGGYLGQGRRFRHFKQVRILKVINDTEGVILGDPIAIRRVSLGTMDMDGDHLALPFITLSFTEIIFVAIF